MKDSVPLARLQSPPQTAESEPLAKLNVPPLTVDPSSLAWLPTPPPTVAHVALLIYASSLPGRFCRGGVWPTEGSAVSYDMGQLVIVRRALGAWPPAADVVLRDSPSASQTWKTPARHCHSVSEIG